MLVLQQGVEEVCVGCILSSDSSAEPRLARACCHREAGQVQQLQQHWFTLGLGKQWIDEANATKQAC